jgi:hypothetical protein
MDAYDQNIIRFRLDKTARATLDIKVIGGYSAASTVYGRSASGVGRALMAFGDNVLQHRLRLIEFVA